MKKFFTVFFVTLGIFFFCILTAGAYVWFVDPFEIRPVVDSFMNEDVSARASEEVSGVDKNPALTAKQEQMLENVGIDPAAVPTSITPAQEACFTEKLGAARIAEIKAGSTPTAIELFTAKSCIE